MRSLLNKCLPTGILLALALNLTSGTGAAQGKEEETLSLPVPKISGEMSLEQAIQQRRAARKFTDAPLTLAEAGQLLWAAQGITEPRSGKRSAPSAMNFYMLDVYLSVETVEGLPPGLYRYQPKGHRLEPVRPGVSKIALQKALGKSEVKSAPALLIIVGLRYRTPDPAWMEREAGHAAQNVFLQATAMGLGTVALSGFKEKKVAKALNLPAKHIPIYAMPVGRKKK